MTFHGCSALALAAPLSLALATPAHAQEAGDPAPPIPTEVPPVSDGTPAAGTEQRLVYTPAEFTRFAPRNAFEMLQNVPGFTVELESLERGLGQASGNVLINGQRLTSKSDTIEGQLARIPIGNVVRIELVEGSTLNIPGLSGQVANVVSHGGGHPSGRFDWRPQWASVAPLRLTQGDISISGQTGRLEYAFALGNDSLYTGTEGPNLIVEAGGLVDRRFSASEGYNDLPKVSITLQYDLGAGARANLNVTGGMTINRMDEIEYRTDTALPAFEELLSSSTDGYNYEISGNVELPLGPGSLKLIGLESYRRSDFVSDAQVIIGGGLPTGSRFLRGRDEGERIGRGEYRWSLWGAEWQFSLEAAYNRLNNLSDLFRLDGTGAFVPVPFPAGTGGVREARYEGILSYGRPLSPIMSLQVALGGEISEISQTGPNALSRIFRRPKGSVNLAWAPIDNLDLSLRVSRKVGQLEFSDFLAGVNLTQGNSDAGNNQLRPPQSWEGELKGSYNLGEWGSATVKLFHHLIQDYVTIIPLTGGGESRGNVPSARNTGVHANATLHLDRLGVRGAKFDVRAFVERSRLDDPVTGLPRAFDRIKGSEIVVDFRHDIPASDWAYGGQFRETEFLPYYRVAEEGLDFLNARFASVYIEHKDVFGLKVNLRAANLDGGGAVLIRSVYSGPRNTAPLLFTEDRQRTIGTIVSMSISGTF